MDEVTPRNGENASHIDESTPGMVRIDHIPSHPRNGKELLRDELTLGMVSVSPIQRSLGHVLKIPATEIREKNGKG